MELKSKTYLKASEFNSMGLRAGLFLLILFLLQASFAINVELTEKKYPVKDMSQEFALAKSNFLSFLGCQRFADRDTMGRFNEQKLRECMSEFLHPSVSKGKILQYEHFLTLKHSVSGLYPCDTNILKNLKNLNENFDDAFCFDSIRTPENKQAIALFKFNKARLPKLIILKF